MLEDVGNWSSFWDLTTPREAAQALRDFYGEAAAQAAVQCADAAEKDGRDGDYQFWMAALAELNAV